MKRKTELSRRSFLRNLSAVSLLGGGPLISATRALAGGTDARSLVCVFLAGGADSFNFVVPGGTQYDDYAATRGVLAVAENDILPATDNLQGEFGFNALLPGLHQLYQNSNLAVVCNVGNLTQPTTQADFANGISLPQSLFAHDAQQKLWQTGSGSLANSLGWGGGIAEAVAQYNTASIVATSTSIAGASTWLTNLQEKAIVLSPNAAIARLQGYDVASAGALDVKQTLASVLAQGEASSDKFASQAALAIHRAIDTAAGLEAAIDSHPVNDMSYTSSNELARQLHVVARLISAREQLNLERQVFFVSLGGWDTHGGQLGRFVPLLTDLNEALTSFQAAINAMGKGTSVTTFTASDFGRTLTSNGDGSDHGWGGHAFVMGGSVNGGKLYGDFPSFVSSDNPDDAGDNNGNFAGRIIPAISVAQYGATLAGWMGLSAAEQQAMLPNLANFTQRDIGFI